MDFPRFGTPVYEITCEKAKSDEGVDLIYRLRQRPFAPGMERCWHSTYGTCGYFESNDMALQAIADAQGLDRGRTSKLIVEGNPEEILTGGEKDATGFIEALKQVMEECNRWECRICPASALCQYTFRVIPSLWDLDVIEAKTDDSEY